MVKKIVIIGAGQLGSRYLQGIAQSSLDISIEVVEPFESSRETAKERYYQIKNRTNVQDINFYDSIDSLSANIDLAIIATGSDVRSKVVTELLEKKDVVNLVLEKVLFQTIEEYIVIEKLLSESNTECWVNHPRRMFPIYKDLKLKLKEAKEVSYNFSGGDWGLGCNGLHFIDHLSYLTGSTQLEINNTLLNNKVYESKRKGFVEFHGTLCGKIANHTFSLFSGENTFPSIHTIVSDVLIAKIDEGRGEMTLSYRENNWERETVNSKIVYFQSELSNVLLDDIFTKGECFLPTYKEAMALHIPFINSLLNHMNRVTGKDNHLCPIT